MRLAVLADIHGNLPALHAVLKDMQSTRPDYVVLDGDMVNPIPYSSEVLDLIRSRSDWAVVRGNHEFYLLDFGTERAPPGSEDPGRWGSLHWLIKQITPEQMNYVAMLPDELTLFFPGTQPIRVSHGVPGRNRVGFHQQMSAAEILPEIQSVSERTLISAHTHVQIDRHLSLLDDLDPLADPHKESSRFFDGYASERVTPDLHWHVINPGSVGLPLGGDPRAHYAILESVPEAEEPGGWRVEFRQVDYDRRPVLEDFFTCGLLEVGGAIAKLFYWEIVTAEPEIIGFFRWCRQAGYDIDGDLDSPFAEYSESTGRQALVDSIDPRLGAPRS